MNDRQSTDGSARWFWPAVFFALVAAAQLWLVAAAGTDIPFQDQWDAEGRGMYPALHDGTARVADLFQPHNEHRIFWTHLLNRGLFTLNGQWDPLVQLAAGALLHAAAAALVAAELMRGMGPRLRWLIALGVALLSLPLAGWHNALWGFQSQVYFAVLFAVAAFGLLAAPAPSRGRMVSGWLAAAAAMLAMGPGMLVAGALAGGLILQWREGRARVLHAVGVAILLAAAGWLHQPVAAHAVLAAGSPGQFLAAFIRLLGWPHSGQPWAAVILNLPLTVVFGGRLLKRRPAVAGEDFVLLLAGWALLVAGAAAWSRGGGAEFAAGVPSRYVDFIVLLPLANAWCVIQLARETLPRWPTSGRLVAGAWGAFLLIGWLGLSAEVLRGVILPRARDREAPVRLMQEFQRTGDDTVFSGQPRLLVPHPNLDSVRGVLRDPRMQGALPPSLQPDQPMGALSRGVRGALGR